ncbi:YdaU family protein [Pseudomonas oryzihabitans]|uniref:YdaU family protein n=1 Tax=Pseudomonas oryzihabitans TaxID=47885 RepID=UPI003EBBB8E6
MNYYSHNIGDYAQATMHLTLVEDAVYSRLLRRYYAEEQPIAADLVMVCRWVGARTSEEKEAVQVVLGEFFDLENGVYRNKRADLEIQAYHAKAETNRLNGKKGGRPSQKPKETQSVISGLANGTQEEPSRNPNQEPVTKNQEPEFPLAPKGEGDALVPDAGVEQINPMFDQFWAKYPNKTCKAKARAKWDKLNPDDALFAQIMAGLDRQCASAAWVKDGGQFVPHPTTWLNGERWNDEVRAAGNVHHLGSRHVGLNDQDYSRDLEANGDGTYRF